MTRPVRPPSVTSCPGLALIVASALLRLLTAPLALGGDLSPLPLPFRACLFSCLRAFLKASTSAGLARVTGSRASQCPAAAPAPPCAAPPPCPTPPLCSVPLSPLPCRGATFAFPRHPPRHPA